MEAHATPERAAPRLPPSATILLVEDEALLLEALAADLRWNGYQVLEAGRGDEALEILKEHPGRIDLLLTDLVLPGLDGWRLAQQGARWRPELSVVYMTGYGGDRSFSPWLPPAALPVLHKPFSLVRLHQELRHVLLAASLLPRRSAQLPSDQPS
jgi:CheY-like chemotaxis protein